MMSRRTLVPLATVICLIGLGSWRASLLAAPNVETVKASAAIALAAPAETPSGYEYVGSKKCKKCHIKQHKSWAGTRMAKAIDILKPGGSKEMKEKFNLDPNKDYSQDATCLKCHTTGFGHPGGYAVPDPEDKKAVRKAKKLKGVGCECCHGPGSGYVPVFEEIMKSKRKYKVEELYAVGLVKISEEVCKTCHNEESPTINAGDTFDYEKRKADGTHEHLPLKQRE